MILLCPWSRYGKGFARLTRSSLCVACAAPYLSCNMMSLAHWKVCVCLFGSSRVLFWLGSFDCVGVHQIRFKPNRSSVPAISSHIWFLLRCFEVVCCLCVLYSAYKCFSKRDNITRSCRISCVLVYMCVRLVYPSARGNPRDCRFRGRCVPGGSAVVA